MNLVNFGMAWSLLCADCPIKKNTDRITAYNVRRLWFSFSGFVCYVKPVILWPPALTQLTNDCATSMSILSVDHTATFTTLSNTESLLCSVEALGEMPATQKLTDISWGSVLTYSTSNFALYCKNHVPKKRRLHLCGWWPLQEWTRGGWLPFWHGAHMLEIRKRKQLWELLNDLKMCGKEFGNRLNPGQHVAVMSPSLIFITAPPFYFSARPHRPPCLFNIHCSVVWFAEMLRLSLWAVPLTVVLCMLAISSSEA